MQKRPLPSLLDPDADELDDLRHAAKRRRHRHSARACRSCRHWQATCDTDPDAPPCSGYELRSSKATA